MLIELLRGATSTTSQPAASAAKDFQDRNMGQRPARQLKGVTVAGPNTGTWTATVVVLLTPDGRGWSPTTKTYSISNVTPIVDDVFETTIDSFGAYVSAYTGDASGTGTNGYQGVNAMVNA